MTKKDWLVSQPRSLFRRWVFDLLLKEMLLYSKWQRFLSDYPKAFFCNSRPRVWTVSRLCLQHRQFEMNEWIMHQENNSTQCPKTEWDNPLFFVLHFYVQHDCYPAQTVGFHMKWHAVLSCYLDHWKVCRSILHAHIQPAPLKRVSRITRILIIRAKMWHNHDRWI